MVDTQKDDDKDKDKDKDGDMFANLSKGLTALKEAWSFSNRMAALQEKYKYKAAPVGELFAEMLGFGDRPNPLELVERQLAEINTKLDRVLAGIEELKLGQLGHGVLVAYLDISDPVYLIDKYSQDLASSHDAAQPWGDAQRREFVDKLLGAKSERDSVAFCAHKIVKLNPATQTPLLFDLLFPYLSAGATEANAHQVYLRGAYAVRSVAETLNKGFILESCALGAAGGDAARVAARVRKVAEKYGAWMRAIVENSFLPFAERIATLRFRDEYLGGHDPELNANYARAGWKAPKPSILQSADELAARLLGRGRTVTLRVVANVPPVGGTVTSKDDSGAAGAAGTYEWRYGGGTQTAVTRENVLDKIEQGGEHLFNVYAGNGRTRFPAESVRKVEVPFADAARAPLGFDKRRLSFLRYQFDLSNLNGPSFQFEYNYGASAKRGLPDKFETKWERWHKDGDRWVRYADKAITYFLLTDVNQQNFPGYFQLPPEAHLSPVLVTYAYAKFGPAPN